MVALSGSCGALGGLTGAGGGGVEAGYHDAEATGRSGGTGETTWALKTGAGDLYATWGAGVWAFGTRRHYPVLVAGGHRASAQRARQPAPSSEAALASLALAPGTLAPAFAATVSAYTAAVGHGAAHVTVTATPAHSAARVVAPADADPGTAGRQVALAVGANAVGVEVAAEDGTRRRYTVAVERARAPGLVAPGGLALAEADTGTYTVALAAAPSGAVTVAAALAPGGSAEVAVSPAVLVFAPDAWATAQTMTVRAGADDDDTEADAATVRHRARGGGYDGVGAEVAVAVADDDAPGLVLDADPARAAVIDPGPLRLAEGGQARYTVRLSAAPSGAVTVSVAAPAGVEADTDGAEAGVQEALEFDVLSWRTARTVTVRAAHDADAADARGALAHGAAGGGYAGVAADLAVVVADDDGLAAPAGLAVRARVRALQVAWEAVAGADGYRVQWRADGEGYGAAREAAVTTTTHLVEPLAEGVRTTVRVFATRTGAPPGPASEGAGVARGLPAVSLDAPRVHEGAAGAGGTLRFTVSLGHASRQTVSVGYADAGTGSATAGVDYTAVAPGTLTFAPGATARTLEVAGTGDAVDESDETVEVALSSAVNATVGTATGTGTLVDDDGTPSVSIDAPRIGEGAGEALRFTVSLSHAGTVTAQVGYADAGTGSATAGVDYTAVAPGTLTFAPGRVSHTVDVAVGDDRVVEPPETVVVALSSAVNATVGTARGAGVIVDDDVGPGVALALSAASVSESGGVATVTATLDRLSEAAVTVTVTAAPGAGTEAGDFSLSTPNTLTIAAGATVSTGVVTVAAVDDAADGPDKAVVVAGTVASAGDVVPADPAALSLALADDDPTPTVALALSAASVSESGGVATVTATLDRLSEAAVTVTVTAAPGAGTQAGDFSLSTPNTLTIAAGETVSAGVVTVTAVDDTAVAPDRSVTVSGTVAGGYGRLAAPAGVTLAIAEDDAVALALSASSIAESGGVATVTATLNGGALSEAVTVTVSAAPGAGTQAGDFILSASRTLTIAAGAAVSTGVVTVAAVDDATDAPDKSVAVSGTAASAGAGVADPEAVTLALADDDAAPDGALSLSPATLAEGTWQVDVTVTATLTHPSSAPSTLQLDIRPAGGLQASNLGVTGSGDIVIAAGATVGARVVRVKLLRNAAVDDAVDGPDKAVLVRTRSFINGVWTNGAFLNSQGAGRVSAATLPIVDDENPRGALALSATSISESGGVATVTATLASASAAATTLTVAPAAGFSVSTPATLTIAAGATVSVGTVVLTAVDDATDAPDRAVSVTAAVRNDRGINLAPASLTLTDDDAAPDAVLSLAPASVSENAGVATVTATLTHPSSEPSTVTVAAGAGAYTVGADAALVIAPGATVSASPVTVTAVDDAVDAPDRAVSVTGVLANGQGAGTVGAATLGLTDDEAAPTVALALSPASVSENGGVATVTAALSHPSSEATTVTVANAQAGDFSLSTTSTLTVAAGATTSAGTVTVTAVDDAVDGPDKVVSVSGAAANGQGVGAVSGATLILADDDPTPTVTLSLSPASVSENGGVATVTARLDVATHVAVAVEVSASGPVRLGGNARLAVAAGATASTGRVVVTAVDDAVDAPDATASVSGAASSAGDGVADPAAVSLTLTDDDDAPDAALALTPASVSEAGGVATVTATLTHPSSEPSTVAVAAAPGADTQAGDFSVSTATTLTIAAGATASTGVVTVAAVDDAVDGPDKAVSVTGVLANGQGAGTVGAATLAIADDESARVGLALSAASVSEAGGVATVTARLDRASAQPTTVSVAAAPGAHTQAGDFSVSAPATLTLAAGATVSTGVVTVAAVDDATDGPDKAVSVSATAASAVGAAAPAPVALVIADDDAAPDAALSLAPASVSEAGGVATVTATLTHPSSEPSTLAVRPGAGAYTVGADAVIVIAPGATSNVSDTVTVVAVDDAVDAPDRTVTVGATLANGQGAGAVAGAALTLTDDDPAPTVALALWPAAVSEAGGVARVSAGLSHPSSAATTVTVDAQEAGRWRASGDAVIVIAPGATSNVSDTAMVVGWDDAAWGPEARTGAVGFTAANAQGVVQGAAPVLTLREADPVPGVALGLTPAVVAEAGGVATVTAVLSGPMRAGQALTVAVGAAPGVNAQAGDFSLSTATTLTLAGGATVSAGRVTVAAVDDTATTGTKTVRVSGRVSSSTATAVRAPGEAALRIRDDEGAPTVALALTPASVSESGGVATVTATLSGAVGEAATVVVRAAAGAHAQEGDFVLSGAATLTFAASATVSTGRVTVAAVDDATDGPDKVVRVSGSVTGTAVRAPVAVALRIRDDEGAPAVALGLTPSEVAESGGGATVRARLSHPSSAATTVRMTAVAGAYTVGADATMVVAAGRTVNVSDTARIAAVDNAVDEGDRDVALSATAANGQGVGAVTGRVRVVDDDAAGVVASPTGGLETTEGGGEATFTVRLASEPVGAVVLDVASDDPAEGAVAPARLTFTAGDWGSAQTVTVRGVDDAAGDGHRSYAVTLAIDAVATVDATYDALGVVRVSVVNRDDEVGLVVGGTAGQATEAGGTATFPVALLARPSAAVTVAVASRDEGEGAVSPESLTFTVDDWSTAQTVTVTGVDDDVDDGTVAWAVRLAASSDDTGYGGLAPVDVAVTTTDDADEAGVVVSPTGGLRTTEAGETATFTVRLASEPVGAVTVAVASGDEGEGVVDTDPDTEGAQGSLAFTAEDWSTAQTVVVAGVDDDRDDGDQAYTVAVGAPASGGDAVYDALGAGDTDDVSLTNVDDDEAGVVASPSAGLVTTEAGGTATFTVRLASEPLGAVVLDVASTDPAEGTVDTDAGTPGAQDTLTFTAGDWDSAQTVTVAGVDDAAADTDQGYTVTLAVDAAATADATYDGLPVVSVSVVNRDDEVGLVVGETVGQATEAGGTATFPVALLTRPSAAVTVGVSSRDEGEGRVSAGGGAPAASTTLTFAAAAWSTAQTVTVTGADDAVDDGTAAWSVRLAASSGDAAYGALAPVDVAVTTTDDDGPPGVVLALNPASLAESGTGAVATVTARLSHASGAATTVTVAAGTAWTAGADPTIVIAAGDTTSTDTATVVAADNTTDEPDRTGTVTATLTNDRATADGTTMAMTGAALTVRDDDPAPTAALLLNPASVSESGGAAAVSAALSHPSSEPSTVTVAAVSGLYTVGADAAIVIAAGATTASDTVTVTAVDDAVHQGAAGRTATVAAALANGQGAGAVTGAALTLADDEALPVASLVLTPASIPEDGGVATVTATLSGASSAAVTLTVGAMASTGAVAGDFALSTATTLTIAAGATTSAGAVTVTANDNAVDAADKAVTVSATAAGGHGVANPSNATLTLADDEATATAALVLTPPAIAESGGLATVTATLSHPTTEAVTLTVATTAVSPAVQGDFTRTGSTLTIAAGATTSTGLVTVTANDNTVASGSKRVRVAASASGGRGVAAPSSETLTLRDDEPGLNVGAVGGQATEGGGRATFTVALTTPPSEAVTVAVASRDAGEGTVSPPSLTFTTTGWEAAQTVTVTGADDRVDDGTVTWNVRLDPSSGDSDYHTLDAVDVPVTTTDDETLPVATLVLTPASIPEAGGVSTVTATLSGPSSEAVTLTVAATPVSPAVAGDFSLSTVSTLTIAAGATTSAGTVTVTAVDNNDATGSKWVTVSAAAAGGHGVASPASATLTLRDDEFGLAESAVGGQATEAGGTATFTVALRTQPTAAVTVTVTSRDPGEGLVSAGGGAPAASTTLTFAAAAWSTAQTVTVTGVDDDVDDGTVTWSVRLDPASGDATFDGLANVDVVVTTTDDDTAGVEASPSAGLVTTEGGGEATFTVRLASEPVGAVVLDVASDDTGEGTVDTDAQMNGAQDTLTFTAGDWSSAQTVTVRGVDDTLTDGDQGYTVALAVDPALTADATYDGLGTVSVSVVNRDDEVTADVNGDGAVNANDGLLMYYAYTFETVFRLENDLGRRVRGFLRTLRGPTSPAAADAGYKAMLQAAWDWRSANPGAGDVNGDGSISANDGLLMYYAYTFETVFKLENDLGRRVRGFLRTLRGAGSPAAADAGYKAMLDAAWGLRGPSP